MCLADLRGCASATTQIRQMEVPKTSRPVCFRLVLFMASLPNPTPSFPGLRPKNDNSCRFPMIDRFRVCSLVHP